MILDFVRDENYSRRHMTPSQRSMVAARMKPLYEEEAKARQKAHLKYSGDVSSGHMEPKVLQAEPMKS